MPPSPMGAGASPPTASGVPVALIKEAVQAAMQREAEKQSEVRKSDGEEDKDKDGKPDAERDLEKDLDGDGRPDLLFLTHGGSQSKATNKLYRQKSDGTFEDVSAGSGLDFPGACTGVAVGEMAFLDEGKRSADVVADQDSTLARLSIGALHEIGQVAPQVTSTFSANLARNLSGRLRRANEQVRMLAH